MTGCHSNRERKTSLLAVFTPPKLLARDYHFPTNGHHISHPPARATAPFLQMGWGLRRAEQVQQVFAGSSGLVGCAHMKCLEARCSRLSRRYSSSSKRSAMPGKTSPWPGSQRGALSEAG